MAKQRKIEDVLFEFEETRPQHGGVIAQAAPLLGMSPAALQRALFRAKKNDPNLHFTTSTKNAQFDKPAPILDVIDADDVVYAGVEEYRDRPNALYGAGEAS